jgi:Spy/CpxP family protein refolding chaperone
MRPNPRSIYWTLLALCATVHAAEPKTYRAPHLPDGHADMQGIWKNSNLTPLERPQEFTQLTIAAADAARLKARVYRERPHLLRAAMDGRNALAALKGEDVRERLSRGQLFPAKRSRSRACE